MMFLVVSSTAGTTDFLEAGQTKCDAVFTSKVNPFLGWGATGTKAINKVYRAVDAAGNVKYVGITSREIAQREAEHKVKDAFKGLTFEPVPGATGLSRLDARIWEQTLVNQYGLGKNGGQLLNQINSIAPNKWGMYGIKP